MTPKPHTTNDGPYRLYRHHGAWLPVVQLARQGQTNAYIATFAQRFGLDAREIEVVVTPTLPDDFGVNRKPPAAEDVVRDARARERDDAVKAARALDASRMSPEMATLTRAVQALIG